MFLKTLKFDLWSRIWCSGVTCLINGRVIDKKGLATVSFGILALCVKMKENILISSSMNQSKTTKISLSERQLKALPLLISATTEGEGCRLAKIAKHTYYEWLKQPAFKDELRRLRNLVVEDAVEVLKARTNKAVDTLVKLLDDPNPMLQRNVANDIIGHVAKFKELHELEERLEVLERSGKN